jgi:HEAT repeat protein
MPKKFQAVLMMVAVVAGVFAAVYLLMWISGGNVQSESAHERKQKELKVVKIVLMEWDGLNNQARQTKLPELMKVWQFSDPDLRWQTTLALGHAGPPALPQLLDSLKDPDDDDRRMYAVWALGIMGPDAQPAFDSVRAALKDPSAEVRNTAVFAIGRISTKPEDTVQALMPVLSDPDTDVNRSASRELARCGKAAVPELRKTLKDKSLDVRRLAITTLGAIGSDAAEVVPDLLALMRDTQSGLQDDTSEALAGIGAPAVAALAEVLQQEQEPALRKRAILALAKVGKPAVPVLDKVLGDRDASVRLQAVTALGQIGAPAVEPLVGALKDPDAEVRQEVVRVLGTLNKNDSGVVPALVLALKDPAERVRGQSIASLRFLRPEPEAVMKELTPVLQDKDMDIRLDAILFLGEFGPAAVPSLASMLKDPDMKVRQRAMAALEEIRAPPDVLLPALTPLLNDGNAVARQNGVYLLWRCGPKALPQITEALKDSDVLVRVAAVNSLRQANADAKVSYPAFVEALADDSPVVRLSATRALSRFGSQALPQLKLALKDKDAAVRRDAVQVLQGMRSSPKLVLPLLAEAQKDDNPVVRKSAADVLGSFGPAALPHLIEALKDQDKDVRNQALDSMKKLEGNPQAMAKLLSEALKSEDLMVRRGAAYALSRFGTDAVDPLIAALKDKDDRIRWEAADSLRVVGPEAGKAIAPLAELAISDPDNKVRKVAVIAMLNIHTIDGDRFKEDPSRAVPLLLESLNHKLAQNRWEAAQILGVLGPTAKDAIGPLTKATQDKDERVRQAAMVALERIKGG